MKSLKSVQWNLSFNMKIRYWDVELKNNKILNQSFLLNVILNLDGEKFSQNKAVIKRAIERHLWKKVKKFKFEMIFNS